jgi:hypothetical protein
MPRWRNSLLVFLALFTMSTLALAQRDLGTITGTITDPSGSAIPNAKVSIKNDDTGVSYDTVSNATGSFTRPALNPGTYTILVEAAGFQKSQQGGVIVTSGEPVGVNLALKVGNTSETVEVTAAAPLLQTESPVIGTNLNSTEISQAPLGGQRTFTFLARLTPGVVPAESGARDALGGGFSANGVRSTGENNFLLNGVDNNVNVIDFINQTAFVIGPSVEAIGDMQVITNGASAEYGRAAGGIVEVSLKSGTNAVHGVAFEILQNTVLDANRWENNLAGKLRNPFKQNQFGVDIGAPIIKNKLFIFGDYQGTRIATAGGSIQNLGYGGFYQVPTAAMRSGDFSAIGLPIYDPTTTVCTSGCTAGTLTPNSANPVFTRTQFAGNRIPVSAQDPVAMKLAALYPATNQPLKANVIPTNDYYTITPGALNTDQGDGRVDYHMNDANSIFGTISWSNTAKTSVQPFAGALDATNFNGVGETDLGRNAMISWTHLFGPTMVNEARVGFSRLVTSRPQANAGTDEYKAFGIGGYDPTTSFNGGLPQIGFGQGYSTIGAQNWLPTKEYNNEWDLIENLTISKGNHSLKIGGEFRELHFPFFQVPYPHGDLNFTQTETAFPTGTTGAANTGDSFASFLLGAIDNAQISSTNFISSTKQGYAGYFQDNWKATSKLTLNLGLRYELFSPIGEQFGRQSSFDLQNLTLYIPAGPNANAPLTPNFNAPAVINGVTFPALFTTPITVSRGQSNSYIIPWDKTDIGPRLGFAYNVKEKTVIRGFYGIFYGGEENQGGNPNRGESAPFNQSPQLNRPSGVANFAPDPLIGNGQATQGIAYGFPSNVFSGFPVSSLQFRSIAEDFRNAMVQEWNLAIQHQFPGNMALEVGYLGNHQSHQLLQPDPNSCPNVYVFSTGQTCNSYRPYKDIGSISGTASFGFGNYDALTASLRKRMSDGLQFQTSYTWGHALADSGTTLSGSNGLYNISGINYNLSYTTASWDIRQNFTMQFNYDIPFGRGQRYGANMNKVALIALGNWHTNGVLSLRSGQPFTLDASGCTVISENGGCGPLLLAGGGGPNAVPAGGRTASMWFNTANFASQTVLATTHSEGNVGLQTNVGPPTRTLDFSIFKDFPFTERMKIQFRAEGTNVANTPQFSSPNSSQNSGAAFGTITSTSAGTERHIQFALRLQF